MNTQKSSTFLKVMVNIRLPLSREIESNIPFQVSESKTTLSLIEYLIISLNEKERQTEFLTNPSLFQYHTFTFDYIFDMQSTQKEVYEKTAYL